MKIRIKFTSSETSEIDFDGSTISDLKDSISKLKETDKSNIKIIFAGKILEDDKTLESYKITDNTALHCLIRKNTTSQSTETTVPLPHPDIPDLSNLINNMQLPSSFSSNNMNSQQMMDMYTNNPQLQQMMNNMMQNPQLRTMMINNVLNNMNIPLNSPIRNMYEQSFTSMLSNPDQFINIMNTVNGLNSIPNVSDLINPDMMNMFNTINTSPVNVPDTSNNIPLTLPVPSTTNTSPVNVPDTPPNTPLTVPEPVDNSKLKEKYEDQIKQIKNMGFEDEVKIIETLSQSYGSVSIALNKLLG